MKFAKNYYLVPLFSNLQSVYPSTLVHLLHIVVLNDSNDSQINPQITLTPYIYHNPQALSHSFSP